MNPEDDPERRIRELEQPLADTARASELGGGPPPDGGPTQGGWANPPQPPPLSPPPYGGYTPPYGDYGAPPPYGGYSPPFPGGTPRSSRGNRVFWILAGVFVVVMLAVFGGIAVFVANRVHQATDALSPEPSSSIFVSTLPPRSTPRTPAPSTTRTRTPTAGPSTTPTTSVPAPGSTLSIAGINENKTVACNNNVVTVSGVSNTIVITGHCTKLTVSGMQNSVTVDAVDSIDASGFNNQVTYHSGSPKISKSGDGNVVQQG
jgi:hypothetical protein